MAGCGARWVFHNRLVLVVGLIAATPVLVSAIHALLAGWTPVFDDAVVTTRSFDVFSSHSPLVGQYSDASAPTVGTVFSAGPMLFWLFAFQARFLGVWAFPVTMALVNTASIMGSVALARRRGGRVFMFAVAIALTMLCRSLGPERLHDIVNQTAVLLPFTLLIFLAWSLACGEYRLLPVTVLIASFIAEAHFSLDLAALAACVVAMVGVTTTLVRSHFSAAASAREHPQRWLFGALAVALVCWTPPLLDQAFNSPGNVGRILQTATANQQTEGTTWGLRAVVRAVGIPPWWLRNAPGNEFSRIRDLTSDPSAAAIVSCVLILSALLVIALIGLRRSRRDLMIAPLLALLLNASVLVVTASIPTRQIFASDKALYWASSAGMFAWLVLGWSLAVLVRPTRWGAALSSRTSQMVSRPAAVPVTGLCITALVAILVASAQKPDLYQYAYRPVRNIASRLSALPRGGAVLVRASVPGLLNGFVYQTAIVYQLRRKGYNAVVESDLNNTDQKLGKSYTLPKAYGEVILIDTTSETATPDNHEIARVPWPGPFFLPGSVIRVSACPVAAKGCSASSSSTSSGGTPSTTVAAAPSRSASTPPTADGARSALRQFDSEFAGRAFDAACALFTERGRAQAGNGDPSRCPAGMALGWASANSQGGSTYFAGLLRSLASAPVSISGNTATITVTGQQHPTTTLVYVGGQWQINSVH